MKFIIKLFPNYEVNTYNQNKLLFLNLLLVIILLFI